MVLGWDFLPVPKAFIYHPLNITCRQNKMTRNTEVYDQRMYRSPNNDRLDIDELRDSIEEKDDSPVVDAVAGVLARIILRFKA